MWKKWMDMTRAWLTRERAKKLAWYGALALLLVILGAGSRAYRNRRIAPEADVPQAAMAVGTPQPLEALFSLPTPSPEPTPEPVAFVWPLEGEIIGEYAPDALTWSETLGQWQSHPGIDIAAAAPRPAPARRPCARIAGRSGSAASTTPTTSRTSTTTMTTTMTTTTMKMTTTTTISTTGK